MSKNKDIKPPEIEPEYGAIHPINQTKEYIYEILLVYWNLNFILSIFIVN